MDIIAATLVDQAGVLGPHHGERLLYVPYGTLNGPWVIFFPGGGEVTAVVVAGKG